MRNDDDDKDSSIYLRRIVHSSDVRCKYFGVYCLFLNVVRKRRIKENFLNIVKRFYASIVLDERSVSTFVE